MIHRFADPALDHQFIHVDPEKARMTPLGGTIAQGFLTLLLLGAMLAQSNIPTVEYVRMGIFQLFI
jgi:acyl dehydratase